MTTKNRIVSGMRPTGKLHIGHYFGALTNWVELQKQYDCFFFVADWHALTTGYEHTENMNEYILDMAADWLAVGIDPKHVTMFIQSHVKQHAELFLLLSMITPLGWLERCPTYKEYLQNTENNEVRTFGFLGYPVLQTADIIAYKASKVPVGEDQIPHLEFAREIVRRFHHIYKTEIFIEPQALLTKAPKILGLDGRKMSKSYNNCIFISDTEEDTNKKISQMITDPSRIKATDPGHPDICSIFMLHKVLNENYTEIETSCKKGEIGCVACKKMMAGLLNKTLEPIREKRKELIKNPKFIFDILNEGSKSAGKICEETLEKVRESMKIIKN